MTATYIWNAGKDLLHTAAIKAGQLPVTTLAECERRQLLLLFCTYALIYTATASKLFFCFKE
jgi:hypothetical protein